MRYRVSLWVLAAMALSVALDARASVDLQISDDETYGRPNAWSSIESEGRELLFTEGSGPSSRAGISIAWRNANQIEEVEVRVQNLGDAPGEGKLAVDVLDEAGKVLLSLEPPDEMKVIRIPARERGGFEGKIIRMKASWELNALIDGFDLRRKRYGVQATIETIGQDSNWSNNRKIKEWNSGFRVDPGNLNAFNYLFQNHGSEPVRVKWLFEQTTPPKGWKIEGVPKETSAFVLEPNDQRRGSLTLVAPDSIDEGSFLEARLSLIDADTGKVIQQHEWFQVYDTIPPSITNYRVVLLRNHTIAIQALVADKQSGVMEATGVKTSFSVDGGRTWAQKAHNYKVGNFVRPTLFETVLGPFAPQTKVLIRIAAMDTAGNVQGVVPSDATAFLAPPTAEQLIQQAYVFPRTQQNPVFDLQKLRQLNLTLQALKRQKTDISKIDFSKPNPLGIKKATLDELGMDAQRLEDLRQDLAKVAKLDLDASAIQEVPVQRRKALGEDILITSTLEFMVP